MNKEVHRETRPSFVPTGAYLRTQGVSQRTFTGRVLVNPRNTTYSVKLTSPYHTLDGTATGATLSMPPDSAFILTNG